MQWTLYTDQGIKLAQSMSARQRDTARPAVAVMIDLTRGL